MYFSHMTHCLYLCIGIVGITIDECSLSDRLSRLMSQNVSLLSLLEKHRIGSSSNESMLSSET